MQQKRILLQLNFLKKILEHIFNKVKRVCIQKPDAFAANNCPGRFFLLI